MASSKTRRWVLLAEANRYWDRAQAWGRQWATGRAVLIDLCARTGHDNVNAVISKLWLIGRSHAAALERSHVKLKPNVYARTAERLARLQPSLDGELTRLRKLEPRSAAFLERAVSCVNRLAVGLSHETKQHKLSLASKYVHYHVPSVPIYDSISYAAFKGLAECDTRGLDRYAAHVTRFNWIAGELRRAGFYRVGAREIDDFVMWWWT